MFRCGASAVMAMLNAGGCLTVGRRGVWFDSQDPADLKTGAALAMRGSAVKTMEAVDLHRGVEWRVVWVDRDSEQQTRSMLKILSYLGAVTEDELAEERQVVELTAQRELGIRDRLVERLVAAPNVTVQVVSYEKIVMFPSQVAGQLRGVYPALNVAAAAAAVHQRAARASEGLDWDLDGTTGSEERAVG